MTNHLKVALLGAACLLLPETAQAVEIAFDSIQGKDVTIAASGRPMMTLCGGGMTCGGNVGRILFGSDPSNPTAWIDTTDGTSSFGGVPSGTVAAFSLSACPSGWTAQTALAGRTIIGAGQGSGLTNRIAGTTGGEEMHTLTIDEMPRHFHWTMSADGDGWTQKGYWDMYATSLWWNDHVAGGYAGANTRASSNSGNNQPHNIMMPWLALIYCQKN